jgi:outer membrane protein assembly factor BamB
VNSGIAYFGDFDGILHAVNVQNGTEAWSIDLDRGVLRGSPAISGNNLVIGSDGGWLIGVNISNRERAWERDLGTPIQSSAIVSGNEVLIGPKGCVTSEGSTARIFYRAVDPTNGDLKQSTGVC